MKLFSPSLRCVEILSVLILFLVGCTGNTSKESTPSKESTASVQPKSGPKRILLLNNTDSPFWDAARAGIKKAQEDLKLSAPTVSVTP
jgi:ABC-type sugar transport system substrate-binding protein